ncbi:hypothetical protein BV20DRAFT_473608 [Pilatotrama ljubarskyi]|nr:hypothetical protein BV20DRAFT_473608 [Pilatotrama ljubarskyi]
MQTLSAAVWSHPRVLLRDDRICGTNVTSRNPRRLKTCHANVRAPGFTAVTDQEHNAKPVSVDIVNRATATNVPVLYNLARSSCEYGSRHDDRTGQETRDWDLSRYNNSPVTTRLCARSITTRRRTSIPEAAERSHRDSIFHGPPVRFPKGPPLWRHARERSELSRSLRAL